MAPMTNSVAYHSASRSPKNRGRGPFSTRCSAEDISDASHGVQPLDLERLVDLVTQPADQHVHDVGLRVEVVLPDVREDHGLGDHPADITHEVLEERELARPQ